MKLLYEAQNTVEAHMVLNLLEQASLTARIDGEYLQGGIGEIQAIGAVRVMIAEEDYSEGKLIVEEWDTRQPLEAKESQVDDVKRKSNFSVGVIGFLCGIAVMVVYYNTPVTYDGIDYNGDGTLDEKWVFVNNLISKMEYDRNYDGEMDIVYLYDRKGLIQSSSSDENFDGVFETDIYYDLGNAVWQKTDTTGDGFKDYKVDYRNGTIDKISFIDPLTRRAIKIQEYGPFFIETAKIDTNGDGDFDTFYEYDAIEEIVKTYNK